ncbi:MAG: immunoglobulin domain-containing protein [Lacunisphaera sp.]
MKARFSWSYFASLLLVSSLWGYDIQVKNGQPVTWDAGTVTMKLLLNTTPVLSDGSTYVSSVQTALQTWNSEIATVQFANETGLPVSPANNTVNEIAFDSTVYGTAFDANVLAITVFYYSTNNPRSDGSYRRTQADIIFNAAYTWDSYRGPLRASEDIQRVALHELGHVLGLNHPDEATPPQSVVAQMNSHVSDLDTLAADDIAGAQSLYGAPTSGPSILSQPGNQSVYVGQTAQFTVAVAGNPVPTFLWQKKVSGDVVWSNLSDSGNYSGTATASLSVGGVTLAMNGDQFRCVATNGSGSATSNAASLTATASVIPAITSQPSSQTIAEGSTVTFAAAASGVPVPAFQWQKGGVNISGATTSLYSISNATAADAGSYTVVVSNFAGTVTSTPAILTVNSPPTVTNLSAARAVLHPGQSLGLAVNATGNGTLGFKWMHNGRVVTGTTSNALTIGTVNLSDSGYYLVDVTNTFGTRRSAPMFVLVTPATTEVLTWGGGANLPTIPPGTYHAVAIAPGLILNADGTVVGLNYYSQVPVPSGLTDIVAISSIASGGGASGFALALKSDGTVTGWGSLYGDTLVPPGLTGVVAISVGGYHALALKSDGTVVAWGEAQYGATAVPNGLKDVIAIAAGTNHSMALKSDGTVVAWGYNSSGETNVPNSLMNVVSIAAGYAHSLALKTDGTVVAWGSDGFHESSNFSGLTNLAAVYAGYYYSLAIKNDGTVIGFGDSDFHQIPVPAGLTNIIGLPSGSSYPLALRDSSGDLAPTVTLQPVSLSCVEGAEAIFSVVATGTPAPTYQWQKNGQDIMGATDSSYTISPASAGDAGSYSVTATNSAGSIVSQAAILTVRFAPEITVQPLAKYYAAVGGGVTFSVTAAGYPAPIYQWRKDGVNINGANDSSYTITKVSAGDAGTYSVQATNAMGTTTSVDGVLVIVPYAPPTTKALGDYDGDGKADLVWTNTQTGERSMWLMNGSGMKAGASLGVVPVEWVVSATADFDGDGKADIFWTNRVTGDRAIWLMDGSTMRSNTFMGTVPVDWVISGTGDFDGDGKQDLVWTNTTTGDRAMWLMNGNAVKGGGYLGTVPVAWQISGVGDFNGDGKADLIWSNTVTGEHSMWFQNGSTTISGATLNTVPVAWVISGVGDFNGDGKADVFLTNTVSGDRVIWLMNGSTITTNAFMGTVPVDWTISGTGDFNGDGKKDVVWTNTTTGDRAMWLLNGSTVTGGGYLGTVPVEWKINN